MLLSKPVNVPTWILAFLIMRDMCEHGTQQLLCLVLTDNSDSVTSQDVRLEIERTQKCALHSCIENLGNFRAFK
jgi:glucose-6-phosphate 1-dehydrogenase